MEESIHIELAISQINWRPSMIQIAARLQTGKYFEQLK